ncbi:hypothetical protein L218DRAFT_965107 [Marasmius fiardii PR-910]|nr:hypothetical protein L218DRAFT_965107 [Marasmius fiardii PR-910]
MGDIALYLYNGFDLHHLDIAVAHPPLKPRSHNFTFGLPRNLRWRSSCKTWELNFLPSSTVQSSITHLPPSQAVLLRDEIHQITSAMASLDAKIAQSIKWQQLKGSLEERLKSLRAASHPFRHLPNRILAGIVCVGQAVVVFRFINEV